MENTGVGKRTFHTELAYVFGLVFVAFGVAFMEKSDFGVSMVVAPAYLLHLKISQTYSFFIPFGCQLLPGPRQGCQSHIRLSG